MMDPLQFAQMMVKSNPNIAKGNPRAQAMIDAIMSGDEQKGINLASNLCKTYKTSPEDAIARARQQFNI